MGEEGCHRLRCARRGARASFLPGSGITTGESKSTTWPPQPRNMRRRDEMNDSAQTLCCRLRQAAMRRKTMKYVCFGYYDKGKFDRMTEAEQNAMFDTCFEYDDHLRANGHWAGGEALHPAETALTLYWKNGNVA